MGWASTVAKAISGSSQILEATGVNVMGWSVRETAGAAAVVRLRNGGLVTSPIIAVISLAANGGETVSLAESGLRSDFGLYVQIVSGAVEGVIFLS